MLDAQGGGSAQINTWVNTSHGVQQASFSVDLDQIPGLIAKYQDAQDKLASIADTASDLQQIAPPGNDEVSKKLSQSLAKMAGSEPGKLTWVVNKTIERLQGQIDQLKAAQQGYRTADENATARRV